MTTKEVTVLFQAELAKFSASMERLLASFSKLGRVMARNRYKIVVGGEVWLTGLTSRTAADIQKMLAPWNPTVEFDKKVDAPKLDGPL